MTLDFESHFYFFILVIEPGDFFKEALRRTIIINRIQTNGSSQTHLGKMVDFFYCVLEVI